MKINKMALVAAGAVFLLSSCVRHSGEPVARAVLFNDKTGLDTDAFGAIKAVHATGAYEIGLANYMKSNAVSAQVKELAAKVVEAYEPILPELEQIASEDYALLPSADAVVWSDPVVAAGDSLQTAGVMSEQDYVAHVKHEQGSVLTQLNRLSRNTDKELRAFATEQLPAIEALYAQAGGEAGHGEHH